MASTEDKTTSTEEKASTSTEELREKKSTIEEKTVLPSADIIAQWQKGKLPTQNITSPTYAQTAKKSRPEDNTIIKSWYNKSLQKLNPKIYESFCHLHTFAQRAQLRPIDFHLSNLEKSLLREIEMRDQKIFSYEKQLNEQFLGYQRARECADNMISYCQLDSSPYWETQLQEIPNKTIRNLIENLQLSDLVRIRIKDFGHFLDAFKSKDRLLQRIKKEEKIHELLTLYKQNLVSTETVLELLRSLSSDPLEPILSKEKVFTMIHHHPCILVFPQEIQNYQEEIQLGIVRELYCLASDNYLFFPKLIQEHMKKINSKFHILVRFQIFSIWEELHHLRHYKSFQLWCASWTTEPPQYDLVDREKIKLDLTAERIFNSYLFHKMLKEQYSNYSYLGFSKNIILYSNLINGPKEFTQTELIDQILLATTEALGPSGYEGQEKYLEEEYQEALVDPSTQKTASIPSTSAFDDAHPDPPKEAPLSI